MDLKKSTEPTYQVVTVFEIASNPETMDSREGYHILARTIDEKIAKEILKDDLNGRGKVLSRPGILLSDGVCYLLFSTVPIDIETNKEEAVRDIALAKLSPEERKSLGVEL